MTKLISKKCVPCEGGAKSLREEDALRYLRDIPGWVLTHGKIAKDFSFKNFKEAMAFTNKVGDVAEKENHHPDILIHGWNKVRLELSTHAIGGLSENDFILAAKINAAT